MSVAEASPAAAPIVERGPFFRVLPVGWRDEARESHALRRAVTLAAVSWLPLLVLAWWADGGFGGPNARSLLGDLGTWFRCLVAIPALVFAAPVCGRRLSAIARQFAEAGLIEPPQRPRFDALLATARRACESRIALLAIVVLAYAAAVMLFTLVSSDALLPWQRGGGRYGASVAGIWQWAVTAPLLSALVLVWAWRWLVWFWLLLRIARLPLRLTAPHPDRCAGLRFVGYSVRAFGLLAFAFGAIAAGRIGNEVIHNGHALAEFGPAVGVVVASVAALACLPTLAFTGRLLEEWRHGVFEYGRVAGEVERALKRKWVDLHQNIGAKALESPDFSAGVDANGYVAGVYDMRLTPLDLRSILVLAVATLLPLLPIVLAAVPLETLLGEAAKLLF